MEKRFDNSLEELALLYGIQTEHEDGYGRPQKVSPETLLFVLRSLGAALGSSQDVPMVLRERRFGQWDRLVEPVLVIWEKKPLELELRVSAEEVRGALRVSLLLEGGEKQSFHFQLEDLPTLEQRQTEGKTYFRKRLKIPASLPWGYHRLTLETPLQCRDLLLISSPRQAYLPPQLQTKKAWGVFAPLYALRSERSGGTGDFSDLQKFSDWVGGVGGSTVATLPFLASFLEESFNPSPYSPVSRLFWNEFYLDLQAIPELENSPRAQEIMGSGEFHRELEELRALPHVEYRRQMALKRCVLEELSRSFFSKVSPRWDSFEKFLKTQSSLQDYARFRAVSEKRRTPWTEWPLFLREGRIQAGDYAEERERYHLYVQWIAREQVESTAKEARGKGLGLYLDFPLGVHPWGYDVWRGQGSFAAGISVGAPPDGFFSKGQDWGFPPLHPEKIREEEYAYFIAAVRHHLKAAGILRIDHVMGFHRLYWIPRGMSAAEGCYVRYPFEEFYAILCLESHRLKTLLVGEDLGTVPSEVRPAMKEHRIFQTYVAQFGFNGNPSSPLDPIPNSCVASLNTHDTPTFAGFWQGLDIQDRREMGLLGGTEAQKQMSGREKIKEALIRFFTKKGWLTAPENTSEIYQACLKYLGSSEAPLILINLEDLWEETQPQNVPGTTGERPNWLRKARGSLEELKTREDLLKFLQEVNRCR
jgi:4-alpha-glucanotransferase